MATPLRSQTRVDRTTVPELLDQRHLAERLQITERHVRRLVAERRIPFCEGRSLCAIRPGGGRRVA